MRYKVDYFSLFLMKIAQPNAADPVAPPSCSEYEYDLYFFYA